MKFTAPVAHPSSMDAEQYTGEGLEELESYMSEARAAPFPEVQDTLAAAEDLTHLELETRPCYYSQEQLLSSN